MAKRTRQAIAKLPVQRVEVSKGEEIRGGSTKKGSSKGQKFMEFKMEQVFITSAHFGE